MIHRMHLNNEPFINIKNKTKKIELRLYDEKRRLIKAKDQIIFKNITTNEEIIVDVINIHLYPSFDKLYQDFNKVDLGYEENEIANPCDMEKYYSKEEQDKYGVVGIEVKYDKC